MLIGGETRLLLLIFWPHYTAYGTLVSWPGTEPASLHWKREILTTGPSGKFWRLFSSLKENQIRKCRALDHQELTEEQIT